jgi:peptide/nickel transport system substrate-binding protein
MISKANFDKVGIEGCRFNPIGTGPFLFVEYQRDAKLTYKRNPNYWDTGKPYIDGITMTVIADSTVRKLAFQKGDVTILRVAGGLDAVELQKAGFLMKTAPGGTFVLVPDSNNPKSPWSNVNVRLAASYALDREALAKALGFGYLNVAYQMFPGYPDTKIPNLAETKFNLAKAKDLLTIWFPTGKTTIHSFSRIVPNDYINAVAGQFRAVGIDVTTDFPEAGKYDDLRFNGWDGMLGHGLANFSNHNQEFTFYFASTVFPTLKRPAGWQQGVDASLASKEVDPKLIQAVLQIMDD